MFKNQIPYNYASSYVHIPQVNHVVQTPQDTIKLTNVWVCRWGGKGGWGGGLGVSHSIVICPNLSLLVMTNGMLITEAVHEVK